MRQERGRQPGPPTEPETINRSAAPAEKRSLIPTMVTELSSGDESAIAKRLFQNLVANRRPAARERQSGRAEQPGDHQAGLDRVHGAGQPLDACQVPMDSLRQFSRGGLVVENGRAHVLRASRDPSRWRMPGRRNRVAFQVPQRAAHAGGAVRGGAIRIPTLHHG